MGVGLERAPYVNHSRGGKFQHALFLPRARSMPRSSVQPPLPPLTMPQLHFHQEERQLIFAATFHTHFPSACDKTSLILHGSVPFPIAPIAVAVTVLTLLTQPPPHPLSSPFLVTATITPIDHVDASAPYSRTFRRQVQRGPHREKVLGGGVALLRES